MTPRAPRIFSPFDGLERDQAADEAICDLVLAVFGHGAGPQVLDYLRSITAGRALGPGASDAELRHLEGQRALVGNITSRMAHARSKRAAAGGG